MLTSVRAVESANATMQSKCMAAADYKMHRVPLEHLPLIAMPMITLHYRSGAWVEQHHGVLRSRLPLDCQINGISNRCYHSRLTPTQALIAARDANPGVDVQLITTALRRNEFTPFERRSAK